MSYDLDIKAHNFLGFDTREFGDNTFYGTIYATGEVGIHGKSGCLWLHPMCLLPDTSSRKSSLPSR